MELVLQQQPEVRCHDHCEHLQAKVASGTFFKQTAEPENQIICGHIGECQDPDLLCALCRCVLNYLKQISDSRRSQCKEKELFHYSNMVSDAADQFISMYLLG